MNKLLILIPTYDRPEMLLRLLKQINSYSHKYTIAVICVNDGSKKNYKGVENYLQSQFKEHHYSKIKENQTKLGFWKIVNLLFNNAKKIQFDYIFQISDDLTLCIAFFDKAISIYENINNDKKICLNLLSLNEMQLQPAWSGMRKNINAGEVYLSNWVDNAFVATSKFMDILDYYIFETKNTHNQISSGVGKQVTQRILKQGYRIYMVKDSLLGHGTHDSVMHTEHRKKRPLTTTAI